MNECSVTEWVTPGLPRMILTYVGISIETNSVDPIGITSVVCKHVGPRSGPTKSRALGRRKVGPDLDPNCLTLLWN